MVATRLTNWTWNLVHFIPDSSNWDSRRQPICEKAGLSELWPRIANCATLISALIQVWPKLYRTKLAQYNSYRRWPTLTSYGNKNRNKNKNTNNSWPNNLSEPESESSSGQLSKQRRARDKSKCWPKPTNCVIIMNKEMMNKQSLSHSFCFSLLLFSFRQTRAEANDYDQSMRASREFDPSGEFSRVLIWTESSF